jgi:NADPH:quinone reductase-like Zn-dependent oxidoreductase
MWRMSKALVQAVQLTTRPKTYEAVRDWSAEGVDLVLDAVGPSTLPQALEMLRPRGRLVNILTATADGDIERDRKEAARRGFRKITFIIDVERAQESMREITNLIDAGLVHVPLIDVLPLEDAAQAHRMIETATSAKNWSSKSLILPLGRVGSLADFGRENLRLWQTLTPESACPRSCS